MNNLQNKEACATVRIQNEREAAFMRAIDQCKRAAASAGERCRKEKAPLPGKGFFADYARFLCPEDTEAGADFRAAFIQVIETAFLFGYTAQEQRGSI